MKNIEYIKRMTINELAVFLNWVRTGSITYGRRYECNQCVDKNCFDCIKNWLNAENNEGRTLSGVIVEVLND